MLFLFKESAHACSSGTFSSYPHHVKPRSSSPATQKHRRNRLRMELLEDRCVLSTLTVTYNSADPTVAHSLPYEVAQAQHGDLILITPAAEQNGPIVLNGALLLLNTNVSIESSNKNKPATMSGGGTTNVFLIAALATVTLDGLNLTDGYFASYAGCILNGGTLTINNCSVDNSTAAHGDGGAIYSSGTLTINNCEVNHNSAVYGGGMYVSGLVTITDCSFNANTASVDGGGLYAASGDVTITDCSFTDNNAGLYGGGIYAGTYATLIGIDTDTFSNNGPDDIYHA